ncbi:MAG: cold-shock protein [Bacteroidetes bacterium]|nr:cold-shock protein [Bacteroidota bacterium]MBU1374283.1 cold-shock protein [Bacteroidota bacterium]MBU1485892.1 cold-shock protein [Bacteroidota bacterium]MBU1760226.1 cold-shock protein [Bacteroidota bacterium]MBU2267262.1 cold-shock protein [Bacteroidota bacterium]
MKTGTVKWFNAQKGFGFIIFEGKDIFVHFKDVEGGASGIKDNDEVEFEIEDGKKGPQAVNVRRV